MRRAPHNRTTIVRRRRPRWTATALVCLIALVGAGASAAASDPAPQRGGRAPRGSISLRRLVHYQDLRALRTFFERVDVGGVMFDVGRPDGTPIRGVGNLVGSLPAEWEAPFLFVRDLIRHVPYSGSLRGAAGTAEAGAGNALDQALLLQALYDARGVPTRLVRGRLSWSDAARLVVGTATPPAPQPGDPWPRWLEDAADHWWLQAQRDGAWNDLDPSFADAGVGVPIGIDATPQAAVPDALEGRVRVELRRGDLVVGEADLPAGELIGGTVEMTLAPVSTAADEIVERVVEDWDRLSGQLRGFAEGIGLLPHRTGGVVRSASGDPSVDRRISVFVRDDAGNGSGPWRARLEAAGRVVEAGPFDVIDIDTLQVRVVVSAPAVPDQVLVAPWGGGAGGRLTIVVGAGDVSRARLGSAALPMYRTLTRLASVEQAARDDMLPPVAYSAAADALRVVAEEGWTGFERSAPEALGWALLHGIDRVSARGTSGRVARLGLRLAAVRWRPPGEEHGGALAVVVSDPITLGNLSGGTSAATLRAAYGFLQSAVLSQVLNRLADRAPETAFDITLRAIGTGQPVGTFAGESDVPSSWPDAVRADVDRGMRAGYAILAPRAFPEEGVPGWWQVGVADGETTGWVSEPEGVLHGRVALGVTWQVRGLDTLLASLPALHRASRWLSNLTGSGPAALSSIPAAACASAAVAADVLSDDLPNGWPRPDIPLFCGPG